MTMLILQTYHGKNSQKGTFIQQFSIKKNCFRIEFFVTNNYIMDVIELEPHDVQVNRCLRYDTD